MPLLQISTADVHLWLVFDTSLALEALQARYLPLLDSTERARLDRFKHAASRQQYLLSRVLVRTVLSRYAPLAPQDWRFTTNAYGRPEIANAEPATAQLSFNLAHTQGLIALAVARGRAVGIDVENTTAREASLSIARSFFAPSEADALSALPTDQQHFRFFEYWTFKESYLKARGLGLSLPLDSFSFDYPDDSSVRLQVNPSANDDPARWSFWQSQPSADHLLALCCEGQSHDVEVIARSALPLIDDQPSAVRWVRRAR